MSKFLFQPDPIDEYEFYPIPIDIHLGIIKIPTKEIIDDFGINNTESVIVGTARSDVINGLQTELLENFNDMEYLKKLKLYLKTMKQSKLGLGLEDTSKINLE